MSKFNDFDYDYDDFYDYDPSNKGRTVKWIAITLAFVLLFSGLFAIIVKVYDVFPADETEEPAVTTGTPVTTAPPTTTEPPTTTAPPTTDVTPSETLKVESEEEVVYQLPRYMSFSEGAMRSTPTGQVSVRLTARVLPETAPNKQVDWKLEWADSSQTANMDDYMTIEPVSDGSTEATLSCKQAFSGEILLTVTTREGKHYDTCVISFVGKPSGFRFNVSSNNVGKLEAPFGNYYTLSTGTTMTMDLIPTNAFGQVGEGLSNFTYQVVAHGSITTKNQMYNTRTDAVTWDDASAKTIDIASISRISDYYDSCFDISIDGYRISIAANCTLENYYGTAERDSLKINYTDRFFEYTDDGWYYEVIVTDTTTGVVHSFNFRPIQSVTGVVLGDDTYEF